MDLVIGGPDGIRTHDLSVSQLLNRFISRTLYGVYSSLTKLSYRPNTVNESIKHI